MPMSHTSLRIPAYTTGHIHSSQEQDGTKVHLLQLLGLSPQTEEFAMCNCGFPFPLMRPFPSHMRRWSTLRHNRLCQCNSAINVSPVRGNVAVLLTYVSKFALLHPPTAVKTPRSIRRHSHGMCASSRGSDICSSHIEPDNGGWAPRSLVYFIACAGYHRCALIDTFQAWRTNDASVVRVSLKSASHGRR